MRIVLSLPRAQIPDWTARFAAALPGATIDAVNGPEPDGPLPPPADYLVCWGRCATLLAAQPRLRAVFALAAGPGHLFASDPRLGREIPLVRLEDAGMAAPMFHYVLAAVLRHALDLDRYAAQAREARWQALPPRAPDRFAVGVLGLGTIGGAIARGLAAQGFAVRGWSRSAKAIDGVTAFAADALDAFLDGLDVVVGALPSTPATDGLLDARRLARLADGAAVVNVGRGRLIVDADLVALLDAGKLAHATLDVFAEEPLPAAHPFWRHPKVTVTPHVSGPTLPGPSIAQVAEKILRLERGLAVTGVVDRARGY